MDRWGDRCGSLGGSQDTRISLFAPKYTPAIYRKNHYASHLMSVVTLFKVVQTLVPHSTNSHKGVRTLIVVVA